MADDPWPPHGHLVLDHQPERAVTLKLDASTGLATFYAWDLVGKGWINDSERFVAIPRDSWWDLVAKIRGGVPTRLYEDLRGRYQSAIHERDYLQTRVGELERKLGNVERLSIVSRFDFYCEERVRAGAIGACQKSMTVYAPDDATALRHAIAQGWGVDGDKHLCAVCWERLKPR